MWTANPFHSDASDVASSAVTRDHPIKWSESRSGKEKHFQINVAGAGSSCAVCIFIMYITSKDSHDKIYWITSTEVVDIPSST